ncbi:MAG TPA: hypothetical protein VFN10_22150, partial [Thermoanaerobaculia bacterium]|nr:hypothetical protein [Thermoanaerobaculia bacterium]
MRLPRMLILAASVAAAAHAQQNLVCPPVANAPGRGCETFHYHVAMYRPDTKQFAELTGINQFASQSSCERAREEASKRNLNIVNWWRTAKGDARYEADRFGPCHCDATIVDGSAVHLTPEQRIAQLRIAEEIRERVREKLIDANAPTDSEM